MTIRDVAARADVSIGFAPNVLLAAVNGSPANGVHIVPSRLVVRGSTPPVTVDGIPQATAR